MVEENDHIVQHSPLVFLFFSFFLLYNEMYNEVASTQKTELGFKMS